MSSRKIRSRRIAKLEKLGEEEVFRLYLELGSTVKLAHELFEPHPDYPDSQNYGRTELYDWLHADEAPGRWERWQKVRQLRGHIEADMVLDEAMKTEVGNASAQRVKVDALKWRASVLNRSNYGNQPQTQVNVGVSVGNAWLEALRAQPESLPVLEEVTEE